jgi:hypothetical protein
MEKKLRNPPAVKALGYGWIRKSERVAYCLAEPREGIEKSITVGDCVTTIG